MKNRITYLLVIVLVCISAFAGYKNIIQKEYIRHGYVTLDRPDVWNEHIAESINRSVINVDVDGKGIDFQNASVYMDDTMTLMMPSQVISDAFDCSVNVYDNERLVIEKGLIKAEFQVNEDIAIIDDKPSKMSTALATRNGMIFVPLDTIKACFGYNYSWDIEKNQATLVNENTDSRSLPYSYNYTHIGKVPVVKDQGLFGTCWAFAALTAMETSLLPEENISFSANHMSIMNSYGLNQQDGGDYFMAISYLSAWQGPVLEQDAPYGGTIPDETLPAVKHVQEVQILEPKDHESIKKMIFKYGGVQSSLYTSMLHADDTPSSNYNHETNAYCYIGEEKPNHGIVIIGWDDNYPKENFNIELEGDGAYICRNSWGEKFGDNGNFYVSYHDTNIGIHNIVYTKIEETDNYDHIYQADLCGWIGLLGYKSETAYFSNVFTSRSNEELKAVSFYATGRDTEYKIYLCENFENTHSLSSSIKVPFKTGLIRNKGYYTIDLDRPIPINKGQRFAVIVEITTPGSERPVAIEYSNNEHTKNVDISDGEGYISYNGNLWSRTEELYSCNVCLKAFTVESE